MTEHWASIGHFPLISYCYNFLFPLGFTSFLFFLFGLSLFPRTILSLLLFFKLKVFIILFPGFMLLSYFFAIYIQVIHYLTDSA